MRIAACLGTVVLLFLSVMAQTPVGVVAKGTVTLSGPHGNETGTITVAAWGEDHCKVSIALGPEILHRDYTAVVNGKTANITAPAGIRAAVPLPIGPRLGCALLPEGMAFDRIAAGGATSLLRDPASQMPSSLAWTEGKHAMSVSYSSYVPGSLPVPGAVTETVDGSSRLQIRFNSIAAHAFTDGDFAVTSPPKAAKKTGPAGGAQ